MVYQPDPAVVSVFVLTALAVGVVSLYAPTAGIALVWTAVLVPWVGILVWRDASPLWLAALVGGILAGLATGAVQALFQSTFLANHPEDAAAVAGRTAGAIGARLVGFALVAGGVWGLLAGGLAWVVRRVL